MRKISLLTMVLLTTLYSFSQSEKYTKAMEQLVPAIDTSHTVDALTNLANSFQRIADAEKTQWLPYYYAALANINAGYIMSMGQTGIADKIDPIADKSEGLLNKAVALTKDNSEIQCVKKMIAGLRFMADPMTRYATALPIAAEALAAAKKLDPENPRVFLLEGQDKFYTPEQYGGSKSEAKKLFEEGIKRFETFKPESNIHPNWGLSQLKYFLSMASQ